MPPLSRKHPQMHPSRDRSFCHSPFWFDLCTPSSARARLLLQTLIARSSVAMLPILRFRSVGLAQAQTLWAYSSVLSSFGCLLCVTGQAPEPLAGIDDSREHT